jgi:hypothetical protein
MTHTIPEPRPDSGLAAHYARLFSEHTASGLSLSEFAARRGISVTSLYRWRQRLDSRGRDDLGDSNALLAVDVIGDVPRSALGSPYEIGLANGIVLRLAPDFDPARVATLLTLVCAC